MSYVKPNYQDRCFILISQGNSISHSLVFRELRKIRCAPSQRKMGIEDLGNKGPN